MSDAMPYRSLVCRVLDAVVDDEWHFKSINLDRAADLLAEQFDAAVKAEREACADACSRLGAMPGSGADIAYRDCMRAIRARGEADIPTSAHEDLLAVLNRVRKAPVATLLDPCPKGEYHELRSSDTIFKCVLCGALAPEPGTTFPISAPVVSDANGALGGVAEVDHINCAVCSEIIMDDNLSDMKCDLCSGVVCGDCLVVELIREICTVCAAKETL